MLEKVTAFVTRISENGTELLFFEHTFAGIQIPTVTVNLGETPEQAALREVEEETGLNSMKIIRKLGVQEDTLPEKRRIIAKQTKVFSRPDMNGFD
jgi:ADP-ribose pyrophosphatase YjhB (NUDIX family)